MNPYNEQNRYEPVSEVAISISDTLQSIDTESVVRPSSLRTEDIPGADEMTRSGRNDKMLTFDLHPLYASILQDGAQIRQGEVLGLDGDLRRVLVAPFDGTIRLLVTGNGNERRVRVFLSEQKERRDSFAAGRR